MAEHKVGTREEWQAARDELAKLEAEAAQRKRGDQGGRFVRQPRLYEEGPVVKPRFGLAVVKDRDKSKFERSSSLYRLLFEGPGVIGARPGGAIPKRAV